MNTSTDPANPLLTAYSLARRSGFLQTALGRRVFRSAYFLYKRYVEDNLQDLINTFPCLIGEGHVLDIGANIGYTASVLARSTKANWKVFAFEPEHSNFQLLQKTAERSEFKGKIVPVQCAVGAENGVIDLWINLGHHADHRVMTANFRSGHPKTAAASVPLVSIDSFLESHTAKVSFIKIDVQGYELAVCQGMQNTLQQNPDIAIVLEFMPSAMRDLGFEPSQLINFFGERGFRIHQVHPRGRLSLGIPTAVNDSSYFDLLLSRRTITSGEK
jgi:FkbM family methyltransferase